MKDYHVLEARYLSGHVLWLRFRDGTAGVIDLGPALQGPAFEPLRDPTVFRRFATIRSSTRWCGRTAPILRQSFSTTTHESRPRKRMQLRRGLRSSRRGRVSARR